MAVESGRHLVVLGVGRRRVLGDRPDLQVRDVGEEALPLRCGGGGRLVADPLGEQPADAETEQPVGQQVSAFRAGRRSRPGRVPPAAFGNQGTKGARGRAGSGG